VRRVKISVFNNDYFIKTDAEDEYIQQIATYLEEKVKETSPQVGAIVVPRPFLLATIKIADDYFRLKREFEEFKNRAEERTRRLVEILESAKSNETFSLQSEERRGESPKD
jgi:cell division protein ZapA